MMTVEEIMTRKPWVVKATDTLETARDLMTAHDVRHLPVVGKEDRLSGILSQRDVLAASVSTMDGISEKERHKREQSITVGQIMSTEVDTVSPYDSVRNAAIAMKNHHHSSLPVVEKGKIIGIVTDSDFVGVAITLLEQNESRETEDAFEDMDDDFDSVEDWEVEGIASIERDDEF